MFAFPAVCLSNVFTMAPPHNSTVYSQYSSLAYEPSGLDGS